jgi:type I pantothenate kinase
VTRPGPAFPDFFAAEAETEPRTGAPPHAHPLDAIASHYRHFTRDEWAQLRADTELTLTIDDLRKLQSTHDPISLDEVEAIYLPLSRLLALYVAATQGLFKATQRFLGADDGKVPYIIGVAGSVAVGKSTTARVLQALLTRWPNTPKVQLLTTDGFLHPNARLERDGLMERKGFPESYDGAALIRVLAAVKAGTRNVIAPVYSHLTYDVVPEETIVVDRPDILIVEGLNVLLPNRLSREGREIPFVSDFFDFSVFLDASEELLEKWYVERFMRLRLTAFRDPRSYFRKFADIGDAEAEAIARSLWRGINLVNLRENILPTRPRASLRLVKGASHRIEEVALRKL